MAFSSTFSFRSLFRAAGRSRRVSSGLAVATIALSTVFSTVLGGIVTLPVSANSGTLRPLPLDQPLSRFGLDEQLFGPNGDRNNLLKSLDYSLQYLATPQAEAAYRDYPVRGITRDRVERSLRRFRQLVATARSPQELAGSLAREFELYQSIGRDGNGEVYFTGYYEPIYRASRTRTAEFRYPIYREPADLGQWRSPMPTREQLEGHDGQGQQSPIRGQELAWLSDRMEAFLVHIQGSARLTLPNGEVMTVGYAGHNGYGYTSVGRELAKDGKLPLDGMTLPKMIAYFHRHPEELNTYLPRNTRFIFFKETFGAPAQGTLNVPVTADRSIAADRSLMPPGALALVQTSLPYVNRRGGVDYRQVSRFVLDQDAGSAILGPGRVDYFMGTGPVAGLRAGVTGSRGRLTYLLLRD